MTIHPRGLLALVVTSSLAAIGSVRAASRPPAAHPDLSGDWTLNREASDLPKEAGFDPDWQDSDKASGASTRGGGGGAGRGGGRSDGGRGGAAGGSVSAGRVPATKPRFESEEDIKKMRQLVEEVRNPPAALAITQSDTQITLTLGRALTRRFHPTGKEETIWLEAGPIGVVTKWEPAGLTIRYLVEKDRELRYVLSGGAESGQLTVQSQFAEKNRGEIITRVYEAAR